MRKESLRSLGLGFLLAAILLAAHATFVQGHQPIEGVNLPSLLDGQDRSQLVEEQEKIKEQLKTLEKDKAQLTKDLDRLTMENGSLSEKIYKQDETITYLEKYKDKVEAMETSEEDDQEQTSQEETNQEQEDQETGFEVVTGQSSSQIAKNLQEQGFIKSADKFQDLIDQWNLSSLIQSGQYELNEDMSIHEIASILTNGAYFYQ